MQHRATFPEISTGNARDTRAALNLAYLNYDSLTPAGQAELLPRMRAMHARLEELGAPVPVPADMKQLMEPWFEGINSMNEAEVRSTLKLAESIAKDDLNPAARMDFDGREWALRDRLRRLVATSKRK